jgi:hypothetical protein
MEEVRHVRFEILTPSGMCQGFDGTCSRHLQSRRQWPCVPLSTLNIPPKRPYLSRILYSVVCLCVCLFAFVSKTASCTEKTKEFGNKMCSVCFLQIIF